MLEVVAVKLLEGRELDGLETEADAIKSQYIGRGIRRRIVLMETLLPGAPALSQGLGGDCEVITR